MTALLESVVRPVSDALVDWREPGSQTTGQQDGEEAICAKVSRKNRSELPAKRTRDGRCAPSPCSLEILRIATL